MLKAIPFRNPTRIGLERKSASAPQPEEPGSNTEHASKESKSDRERDVQFLVPRRQRTHRRRNKRTGSRIRANDQLPGRSEECVRNKWQDATRYNPTSGLNPASCA